MDSLATVLRRIPLFADLPPGSFAKIIADLREERHPPGTVICYEGDEAHDFYIIKSGEVEVLVNRGWNQRELVAVNGPNEWFGERALFSDRPRSATVVARTEVELWRLTKEKFDALVEENPWLILHFTQVLSDRLYQANQELSKKQEAFNLQIEVLFHAQPPAQQELLTRTAILTALDPPIVRDLLDRQDAAAALTALEAQRAFVLRNNGVVSYPDAVREFLLSRLTAEVGVEGLRDLHRRAAGLYERVGQWDQAIDHYLDAEEFSAAAQLLAAHADAAFAADRVDLLRKWLNRLPEHVFGNGLGTFSEQLKQRLRPENANVLPTPHRRLTGKRISTWARDWAGFAIGLTVGLSIWSAPPLDGLDAGSMRMLALLAWAVIFWAFDVLPDYVVGLGMIIGWILFAIVPPRSGRIGFHHQPVLSHHRRPRHHRFATKLGAALPPRPLHPALLPLDLPRSGAWPGAQRHGDHDLYSRLDVCHGHCGAHYLGAF